MLSILNLVIYSDNDAEKYEDMFKTLDKYYRIYENHTSVYVKTYYMKCVEEVEDYQLEDNILYINGKESFAGIITKTLKGFKYFEKDLDKYDYVVRTNLSTIINFHLLSIELENNPIHYYGGGHKRTLQWKGGGIDDETWYGTEYIEGTAIIFTPQAVKHIIANEHLVRKTIIDDVALAIFIREHAPHKDVQQIDESKYVFVPSFFLEDKIHFYGMLSMVLKHDFIFYRNKGCSNRNEDSIQMSIIAQILSREEKDRIKSS